MVEKLREDKEMEELALDILVQWGGLLIDKMFLDGLPATLAQELEDAKALSKEGDWAYEVAKLVESGDKKRLREIRAASALQFGWRCLRCGHVWRPRKPDRPRQCTKCRTVLWDRPKSADR